MSGIFIHQIGMSLEWEERKAMRRRVNPLCLPVNKRHQAAETRRTNELKCRLSASVGVWAPVTAVNEKRKTSVVFDEL